MLGKHFNPCTFFPEEILHMPTLYASLRKVSTFFPIVLVGLLFLFSCQENMDILTVKYTDVRFITVSVIEI